MARNPLTSSERRGILAVAALALLITGGGLWLARCGRQETTVTPEEVEMLLDGGDTRGSLNDSSEVKKGKKRRKSVNKNKKSDAVGSSGPKTYRKRSLLDEPVEREKK